MLPPGPQLPPLLQDLSSLLLQELARFLIVPKTFPFLSKEFLTDNYNFQCGVKGGAANGRIVGGQETEEHEYPWQVKLENSNVPVVTISFGRLD